MNNFIILFFTISHIIFHWKNKEVQKGVTFQLKSFKRAELKLYWKRNDTSLNDSCATYPLILNFAGDYNEAPELPRNGDLAVRQLPHQLYEAGEDCHRENNAKSSLLYLLQMSPAAEISKNYCAANSDHLRLSWGSVHGSYSSNIELDGLTWGLFFVLQCVCIERTLPKVRLRWLPSLPDPISQLISVVKDDFFFGILIPPCMTSIQFYSFYGIANYSTDL